MTARQKRAIAAFLIFIGLTALILLLVILIPPAGVALAVVLAPIIEAVGTVALIAISAAVTFFALSIAALLLRAANKGQSFLQALGSIFLRLWSMFFRSAAASTRVSPAAAPAAAPAVPVDAAAPAVPVPVHAAAPVLAAPVAPAPVPAAGGAGVSRILPAAAGGGGSGESNLRVTPVRTRVVGEATRLLEQRSIVRSMTHTHTKKQISDSEYLRTEGIENYAAFDTATDALGDFARDCSIRGHFYHPINGDPRTTTYENGMKQVILNLTGESLDTEGNIPKGSISELIYRIPGQNFLTPLIAELSKVIPSISDGNYAIGRNNKTINWGKDKDGIYLDLKQNARNLGRSSDDRMDLLSTIYNLKEDGLTELPEADDMTSELRDELNDLNSEEYGYLISISSRIRFRSEGGRIRPYCETYEVTNYFPSNFPFAPGITLTPTPAIAGTAPGGPPWTAARPSGRGASEGDGLATGREDGMPESPRRSLESDREDGISETPHYT